MRLNFLSVFLLSLLTVNSCKSSRNQSLSKTQPLTYEQTVSKDYYTPFKDGPINLSKVEINKDDAEDLIKQVASDSFPNKLEYEELVSNLYANDPKIKNLDDVHRYEIMSIKAYTAADYSRWNRSLRSQKSGLFEEYSNSSTGTKSDSNDNSTNDQVVDVSDADLNKSEVIEQENTYESVRYGLEEYKPLFLMASSGLNKLAKKDDFSYTGKVFRGSNLSLKYLNHFIEACREGNFVYERAFTSTSSSVDVARNFSDPTGYEDNRFGVIFYFDVKEKASIKPISNFSGEDEILLPPGTILQVNSIQLPHHDYRMYSDAYEKEMAQFTNELPDAYADGTGDTMSDSSVDAGYTEIEDDDITKKWKGLEQKMKEVSINADPARYHIYATIIDDETLQPEAPPYHELPYNTAKQKVIKCTPPSRGNINNIPFGDEQQHVKSK